MRMVSLSIISRLKHGDAGQRPHRMLRLTVLVTIGLWVTAVTGSTGRASSESGDDVNALNARLLESAAAGDVDAIEAALSGGAEIDHRDESGKTALHLAAAAGHPEAVESLLNAGANPAIRDNQSNTAAQYAILHPAIMMRLHTSAARRRQAAPNARASLDFDQMQQERLDGAGGRYARLRMGSNQTMDPELAEALDAVGYSGGSSNVSELSGVTRHDRARAWDGINLYVSGHRAEAILTDMDGVPIHRWKGDYKSLWSRKKLDEGHSGNRLWRKVLPLPAGELLAIFDGVGIVKLDYRSRPIWAIPNLAHHDLDIDDQGRIYVLTRRYRIIVDLNRSKRLFDELVTILSPDGETVSEVSLLECLRNAPEDYRYLYHELTGDDPDLLHSNSLRILGDHLERTHPAFKPGRILTSFRNLDAIAVIDLEQERLVWARRGVFKQQHDPRILDNGHLLLFDNQGLPNRSAALEYALPGLDLVWQFRGSTGEPFYSRTCGAARRLPNGNTLLVETDNGRAIEVTTEGEIVWEFYNPHRAGVNDEYVASLFDLIRLPKGFFESVE